MPYNGESASGDGKMWASTNELKSEEVLAGTLVVVAGDHGEGLGDHEEQTHSILVYESTIRVPLIMSYPGVIPAGLKIKSVVSLADVTPTILEFLEIPAPAGFDGMSLADLVKQGDAGKRFVYSESMFPYLNYGWGQVASL